MDRRLICLSWLICRLVLGDALMHHDCERKYPSAHPHQHISGAVVPLSSFAMRANHRKYPHRQAKKGSSRRKIQAACGYRRRIWSSYWPRLPLCFRSKIQSLRMSYPPHRDRSRPTASARQHDRPFQLSPSAFKFPWQHVMVNDQPLGNITVKAALRAMGTSKWVQRLSSKGLMGGQAKLISTGLAEPAEWKALVADTTKEWESLWARLDDLLMPSAMRSNVPLFQHCLWTQILARSRRD
ncbi:hypothetical protein BDZ90DRAFT_88109 [Jaminaea rosea]|uniref:Uncharacterized protein n=1 Tax=Jaminaea rosea TaxID=1569628 RepID=A0A316UI39_9BASI|nr:hypothetical protein BDZ90DRAFT_88109 [Jaminaea rosea]PWN24890.1 hypothetical protein BDZ90DRAFT_88109 [Jaminaea rosea]